MKHCKINNCDRLTTRRGMCKKHYMRWWTHGDPHVIKCREKGQGSITPHGYRTIMYNGIRKPEHVWIAEKALGKPLPKGAHVHHVNYNRLDNRPSNLVICPSIGYHKILHRKQDAQNATGFAHWRRCRYCKKYDDPKNLTFTPRNSTYHNSCYNQHQRLQYRANRMQRRIPEPTHKYGDKE